MQLGPEHTGPTAQTVNTAQKTQKQTNYKDNIFIFIHLTVARKHNNDTEK